MSKSVVVVGGAGHVGLPLAIAFAGASIETVIYDIDKQAVEAIRRGAMPFAEEGAPERLKAALTDGHLIATTDPSEITACDVVVIVIGTPVDEHLNPDPLAVLNAVAELLPYLRDGQLLILRSTVYPGVTERVERLLEEQCPGVAVAFCPERIAEGKAFTELYSLPQIVAATSDDTAKRASDLFQVLTEQIIYTTPAEAELAKLFTNTYRYLKFAAANQLFMMANDYGVDYERVRTAVTTDYPRAADLPGAGFAAGPCLFKDTMQLAAFHRNNYVLGHAAMLVNEGLPHYLVSRIEERFELSSSTVAILGMAFKAESDDTRSSLSYKLKHLLQFKARDVLCTDPFVTTDRSLLPVEQAIQESDIIIIGAPHSAYLDLDLGAKEVVDVWNLLGGGVII